MISKGFVYEKVLPQIQEKGRLIDVLLIKSLFEDVDVELIEELKRYQNKDLGFGHGLEPDVQMKESSVLATTVAIDVLAQIRNPKYKEPLVSDIVTYLESQYDQEKDGFKLVTKDVENSPHAIWWNYKDYDKNFPFGNPDGQIIGFLFANRKHLKTLDINHLINKMISFIVSNDFLDTDMHTLFNVLHFNKLVDEDIKNLIHDRIHLLVDKLLKEMDESSYGLEPYKIYNIDPHFTFNYKNLLNENLQDKLKDVKVLNVYPNWTWHQYDDLFEQEIKYQWMGYLYYTYIKALRLHRNL